MEIANFYSLSHEDALLKLRRQLDDLEREACHCFAAGISSSLLQRCIIFLGTIIRLSLTCLSRSNIRTLFTWTGFLYTLALLCLYFFSPFSFT